MLIQAEPHNPIRKKTMHPPQWCQSFYIYYSEIGKHCYTVAVWAFRVNRETLFNVLFVHNIHGNGSYQMAMKFRDFF